MAYIFGIYQYGKTSNGLSKSENLLKVCTVLATTNDGGQSGWKTGNIFVLLMKMTEKTKTFSIQPIENPEHECSHPVMINQPIPQLQPNFQLLCCN